MKRERVATRCPTCGRMTMVPVVRDIETKAGGRTRMVRGVGLEECTSCGERLYSLEALHRLRQARRGARSRRAA